MLSKDLLVLHAELGHIRGHLGKLANDKLLGRAEREALENARSFIAGVQTKVSNKIGAAVVEEAQDAA